MSKEHSKSIIKWKTRPREDGAVRVRNNQRRHRARVKSYIAELEHKLENAQKLLLETQTSLSEVTKLLHEARTQDRRGCCKQPVLSSNSQQTSTTMIVDSSLSDVAFPTSIDREKSPSPEISKLLAIGAVSSLEQPPVDRLNNSTHSNALTSDTTQLGHNKILTNDFDIEKARLEQDEAINAIHYIESADQYQEKVGVVTACSFLEPQTPHESTTLCSVAFPLIEQHNHRELETSVIYTQLQPGFRAPGNEYGGCRVENKVLFALLDYVSG